MMEFTADTTATTTTTATCTIYLFLLPLLMLVVKTPVLLHASHHQEDPNIPNQGDAPILVNQSSQGSRFPSEGVPSVAQIGSGLLACSHIPFYDGWFVPVTTA